LLTNDAILELWQSVAKLVRQSSAKHRRKPDLPCFFWTRR
jgi:hypothetical protein